ncbi:MAG: capsule biosynthesis protein CapA [Pseudomonadota bacterium]
MTQAGLRAVSQPHRVFLFLQGPHGPFLRRLAQALHDRGARVRRINFNAADAAEWARGLPSVRFMGPRETYREWLIQQIEAHGVTDIVFYGDTRAVHRIAWDTARMLGITVHNLEEGYLRPRFVTYERGGANGFSRAMDISLPQMAGAVGAAAPPDEEGQGDSWGDTRQHRWYSFVYYVRLMLSSGGAREHTSNRAMPMWQEVGWYMMRALGQPYIRLWRWWRQSRLRAADRSYHLVLLQLSFDASMREHSAYPDTAAFIEEVIDAFAESAPKSHLLVFKAHPFESGRERLGHAIRDIARDLGVSDRVVFIDGGMRLAGLMNRARSVITVNSTGAHQALWRGIPVLACGRAVYRKPGIVSEQSLQGFFRHPRRPDLRAYWILRRFLLATSQFSGSFYAETGILRLLRDLPDAMLRAEDSYDIVGVRCGSSGPDADDRRGGSHPQVEILLGEIR